MNEDKNLLKTETLKFLNCDHALYTHAATLTLKQSVWMKTAKGSTCIKLDAVTASRNLRYALNRVNRYFYGNGHKRKPDQYSMLVIAILEGQQNDKRMHYHLQLGNLPNGTSNDDLRKAFTEAWSATEFGDTQIDIQALYGTHWLSYITKQIGTANTDCIDWQNVRTPLSLRTN